MISTAGGTGEPHPQGEVVILRNSRQQSAQDRQDAIGGYPDAAAATTTPIIITSIMLS
jgi:hypothetical protein